MSTMECLETNECRKNCNVLRMLDVAQRSSMPTAELTADGNDCAYADTLQLGTFEPTLFSNSDLATNVAASLERVLRTGNEVRGAIGQVGNELHVALSERSKIDMALGTLWQQYVEASRSDRKLTDVEVNYFSTELAKQAQSSADVIANLGVGQETITFAQAILDARSLESMGLVLDSGMSRTVTELFANANSGQSTLLVGDKGIAKTLAAKYVSAAFAPNGRPRFISGDGSLMKDEFIGKVELSVEDGATKTVFREGVLVECMEQGIPLVLDEVNLIDPAIAMRLQDILLRKPGDVITLQEDGGRPITIKRGFTVFATANEASERYQARAILDPAFRDRFDTLPIEYPDGGTDILDSTVTPEALTRLAYATIISPDGIANPRVSADDALWLARLAHASQQLYAKPPKDINGNLPGRATANFVDTETPVLKDCITPRKMVELLKRVCDGSNPYDVGAGLRGVAYEAIGGMQHRSDRETMHAIILLLSNDPASVQTAAVMDKMRIKR